MDDYKLNGTVHRLPSIFRIQCFSVAMHLLLRLSFRLEDEGGGRAGQGRCCNQGNSEEPPEIRKSEVSGNTGIFPLPTKKKASKQASNPVSVKQFPETNPGVFLGGGKRMELQRVTVPLVLRSETGRTDGRTGTSCLKKTTSVINFRDRLGRIGGWDWG